MCVLVELMFRTGKTVPAGTGMLSRTRNRHRINTVLLFAALLLLVTAPAAPEERSETTAILDGMLNKSGGCHWSGVTALHLLMTVKSGGMAGHGDRWEDLKTGRYVECISWPDFSTCRGFDGITPWRQGRSGIAYTLGDIDAARVAADESFRVARAWWFPDRHPATIAGAKARMESGHRFDILDVTPEGGRQFEMWIDNTTHLLTRTDEQQAEDHVVTAYGDYRPVQGIMLPFSVRSGDGVAAAFDEVETVQAVEVNPVFSDSIYGVPPRPPADLELPPDRDSVEVPFQLTARNRIIVPLTINGGATVAAEFDSGGSLILQPATISALGIAANGKSRQGGNFEGTTTARNGRLDSVALGQAIVRHVAFHSYGFAPDQPHKALVGLEILQRFVVQFDFDRHMMTLTRPTAFVNTGPGAVVPFHFQDNQPEIKGSIDGIAALLTMDTGDGASLDILAPFARRYDLVRRYHADISDHIQAAGPTREVWARRRPSSVAFYGADGRTVTEVHQPMIRISLERSGFGADRDVSANVGLGILRQFNLTFDYDRQRIILEPNHLYGQREVFNRAGLRLQKQGAAWSISSIYPGSPAADAGLRLADVVLSIDGQTADTLSSDSLWSRFEAPIGTKLTLRVRTLEGERSIVLSLRDIL